VRCDSRSAGDCGIGGSCQTNYCRTNGLGQINRSSSKTTSSIWSGSWIRTSAAVTTLGRSLGFRACAYSHKGLHDEKSQSCIWARIDASLTSWSGDPECLGAGPTPFMDRLSPRASASRRNPRLNSRPAPLSTLQRRPQQTAPHDSGPMWVASHSAHLAGANPYTGGN
jgi:hypothetical protein